MKQDSAGNNSFDCDSDTLFEIWHRLSSECKNSTEVACPLLMKTLRRGFWLLDSSLDRRQATYKKRNSETFEEIAIESASFYISMLVSASIRNTWLAVDLLSVGAYSTTLGLCRNLLECYKRAMYLRFAPQEVFRFHDLDRIPAEIQEVHGYFRRSKLPTGSEYERVLTDNRKLFTEKEWEWISFQWQAAKKLTEDLHAYNHASLESTMDMVVPNPSEPLETLVLVEPGFSADSISVAGQALLTVLLLLNYEALRRMQTNPVWVSRWRDWNKSWTMAYAELEE